MIPFTYARAADMADAVTGARPTAPNTSAAAPTWST